MTALYHPKLFSDKISFFWFFYQRKTFCGFVFVKLKERMGEKRHLIRIKQNLSKMILSVQRLIFFLCV